MSITSKGKGKSGGSRVVTCVKIVAGSVYLLSIYDKSEKESISDKELDDLLKIAGTAFITQNPAVNRVFMSILTVK